MITATFLLVIKTAAQPQHRTVVKWYLKKKIIDTCYVEASVHGLCNLRYTQSQYGRRRTHWKYFSVLFSSARF